MLIQRTLKYISSLIFSLSLLLVTVHASAQTDSTDNADPAKDSLMARVGHQLNIGVDIVNPILNSFSGNKKGYEAELDYYIGHDLYFVAEGGFGTSKVNYNYLQYNTNNTFYRIGINRCLLQRTTPTDWDMFFIGARFGMAFINRTQTTYTIVDSFWGNATGSLPNKSFSCYWAEVNAGMRVELYKALSVGWTVRGKFLLNSNSFQSVAPQYIAGYGRGDKNSTFDFNVYVNYAIRWKKSKPRVSHK